MKIRIGTRSSQLAMWQAEYVAELLKEEFEDCQVELVTMSTKGDRILEKPLAEIGGKGLFTEELEKAMLSGEIDIAVHSLKDMPVDMPEGLTIGAYTKREIPWDVLVSPKYGTLNKLPEGAVVGTSSLRRQAQLLRARPDLKIELLRGNVNTRLRKVEEGQYDAIVLAMAGLKRLGLDDCITEVFPMDVMLPAVGQGALAIECVKGSTMEKMLQTLEDEETYWAVKGERSFLRTFNGNCQVPVGVHGIVANGVVTIHGLIASLDGREIYEGSLSGMAEDAEAIGKELAEGLLADGADTIVEALKVEGVLK